MLPNTIDPLKKLAELEPTKKVLSLYDEFKTFAFRGNIIDLAVAVIIGQAFGNIVNALVKQIMMPVVSIFLPTEQACDSWGWKIDGKDIPYGKFISELVNFLVITLAVFLFVVKFLGWIMRSHKEEAVPQLLTKEQQLLTEIRDLLKMAQPAAGQAAAATTTTGGI